jgi:tetratricopeptide (TPR) repeat protein
MTESGPSDGPDTRASRLRRLSLVCLPVLSAGLVYLNALHNPFAWDDFHTVADNRSLDTLWNLRGIVLQDVSRPLVNLSFAIDRAIWGSAPFGFHVSSVLLHMLNVLLLFLLVRHLAADAAAGLPDDQSPRARPEVVASAAAWLFAVHPLMTEAVGYISGRADVLSATCMLAAFLTMRRWTRGGGRGWLIASIAAWGAGLASKETAMVFPLLLGSYRVWMGRSMTPAVRQRLTRAATGLGIAMAVAGGSRLALLLAVENPGYSGFHWQHVLVDLDVVRRYVMLLVTPGKQSVFHPVVSIASFWQWRALGAVAFTAGLLGLAWALRPRHALAGLGILWFLLTLAPAAVLVLFDLGHPMAEHRTYFANAGLFMAASCGVGWLLARPRASLSRRRLQRRLLMAVLVLTPVTLAGQTLVRNRMWTDPRVLWLEAAERAPDIWLPHLLLGEALRAKGMRQEAVVAFRNAVRLRPDNADAYLKLGVCLAELGRFEDAANVFSDLERAVPESPVAAEGLGTMAMLTGHPDQARSHFYDALRLDPANIAARQSLALLSVQESQPAEAQRLCEEIEHLAPGSADAAECMVRNRGRRAAAPLQIATPVH